MATNKRSIISKALSRFTRKAEDIGGKIRSAPHRVKSGIKTRSNIRKLMSKYKISSTTHGEKNYNTVARRTSKLFDEGKAKQAREYLKQQGNK